MYNKKIINRFKNPRFSKKMKSPDAVGEVGNMKCVLPDEKIHVNSRIINMQNVSEDYRVIGSDGKYHVISEVYNRKYIGKVVTIKNKLGKTSLTEDHLLLAIKVPKKREFFDTAVKKTLIPAWYHAEDLEQRDIIIYPIFNETVDTKYIDVDLSIKKYDFNSIEIPKKIAVNADFLRLCGYFLAEGHTNVKNKNNVVTFAFNIKEKAYIKDVKSLTKKIFGLNTAIKEYPKKHTAVIYICNVFVAKIFKRLFGCGAENKKLSDFMMLLPPKKQKHLIKGLWRGDGYVALKRKRLRAGYCTISEQLIHQMKLLLLRQKILPSVYHEKARISKWAKHKPAHRIHIGDRNSLINLLKILNIKYKHTKAQRDHSWFDKNFLYTPITNKKLSNYSGEVYNLEVPDIHSFATDSLLIHNCGDIMRIYLKIKNNKIADISFQTYGCPAAIASTDVICELAKGKTLETALGITPKDVVKKLGQMPAIKMHCSVLGLSALKDAVQRYKRKQQK